MCIPLIPHAKNDLKVKCLVVEDVLRLVGENEDIRILYRCDVVLWKNQCKKPHISLEMTVPALNQLVQTNPENEEYEK
jgi:hypothetical protein